jgi:hypothetical protein
LLVGLGSWNSLHIISETNFSEIGGKIEVLFLLQLQNTELEQNKKHKKHKKNKKKQQVFFSKKIDKLNEIDQLLVGLFYKANKQIDKKTR